MLPILMSAKFVFLLKRKNVSEFSVIQRWVSSDGNTIVSSQYNMRVFKVLCVSVSRSV